MGQKYAKCWEAFRRRDADIERVRYAQGFLDALDIIGELTPEFCREARQNLLNEQDAEK